MRQCFLIEQVALFGAATGVAHHAGRPTNQGNWLVTCELHAAKRHDRNQVAQV